MEGADAYAWVAPAESRLESMSPDGSVVLLNTGSAYSGGSLKVAAKNVCATSGERLKELISAPLKPVNIYGPDAVKKFQAGLIFSVDPVPGVAYTWTVPGNAKIVSGQNSSSITVNWGGGPGNVIAKAYNSCATSAGKVLYVSIANGASGNSIGREGTQRIVSPHITPAFLIYPNPARDIVRIIFESPVRGKFTLRITDITGKQMLMQTGLAVRGTNTLKMNISHMKSGVYIVSLFKDNDPVKTTKLVVD